MMRLSQTIPKGLFNKIILVEGKYAGYPDGFTRTSDTWIAKYVDKFGKDVVDYIQRNDVTQVEKRNEYFKTTTADYGLVIDSDEYFMFTSVDAFKQGLEENKDSGQRCFPIIATNLQQRMTFPRLFRNPHGLHYTKNPDPNVISHGQVFDENNVEIIKGIWDFYKSKKYFPGVQMVHDKMTRGQERVILDLVWQNRDPNR